MFLNLCFFFFIKVENGWFSPIKEGLTSQLRSLKLGTCRGQTFFYLFLLNSILKPAFSNVCDLPFKGDNLTEALSSKNIRKSQNNGTNGGATDRIKGLPGDSWGLWERHHLSHWVRIRMLILPFLLARLGGGLVIWSSTCSSSCGESPRKARNGMRWDKFVSLSISHTQLSSDETQRCEFWVTWGEILKP